MYVSNSGSDRYVSRNPVCKLVLTSSYMLGCSLLSLKYNLSSRGGYDWEKYLKSQPIESSCFEHYNIMNIRISCLYI